MAQSETAKKLDREVEKTYKGLRSRSMKEEALQAPARKAREHPANAGKHLRWSHDSKTESRKVDGYEVIPESEGGARVGDQVLVRVAQSYANDRDADIRKINRQKLAPPKDAEMRQVAEEVAAIMRSQGMERASADELLDTSSTKDSDFTESQPQPSS